MVLRWPRPVPPKSAVIDTQDGADTQMTMANFAPTPLIYFVLLTTGAWVPGVTIDAPFLLDTTYYQQTIYLSADGSHYDTLNSSDPRCRQSPHRSLPRWRYWAPASSPWAACAAAGAGQDNASPAHAIRQAASPRLLSCIFRTGKPDPPWQPGICCCVVRERAITFF